ncbi:MAG TPA: TIGR03617 family F420-dependent LLM class oxidoreductase [Anaerolineales bacterium]|nr:TIGR03617 family F420-dependent LLM class oxidoreductase [Anaerolineales bacterium]
MLLDALLPYDHDLKTVPETAKAAEELGFDALWSAETQHDPFLPGPLVFEHTARISFGTAIAVAFARSPATLAHTAWDLARMSGGRFILGLGTQIKPHIERRFGMTWPASPAGKLEEQVAAIRAFWRAWQEGERLNHRGEYYKLTLTSPFFDPGPIRHPDIPIYLAGVNTGLAALAGRVTDGFHVHPLHTARYLREVLRPAIAGGAAAAGREPADCAVTVTAFVASDERETAFVRAQIAFYASTPGYRSVLALHGWEAVGEALSELARRKAWSEMPPLIDDTILAAFAVVAPEAGLPDAIAERYAGLADRLALYRPFVPGERDGFWKRLVHTF